MEEQANTSHDEADAATEDALSEDALDAVAGGTPRVDPTWQQRQGHRQRRPLGIYQRRYAEEDDLAADAGKDSTIV